MTSPITANVFAVINRAALGIAVGSCLAIIAIELLGDYAASVGLGGALHVAVTINIIALGRVALVAGNQSALTEVIAITVWTVAQP
jgi:hypothetical protein